MSNKHDNNSSTPRQFFYEWQGIKIGLGCFAMAIGCRLTRLGFNAAKAGLHISKELHSTSNSSKRLWFLDLITLLPAIIGVNYGIMTIPTGIGLFVSGAITTKNGIKTVSDELQNNQITKQ